MYVLAHISAPEKARVEPTTSNLFLVLSIGAPREGKGYVATLLRFWPPKKARVEAA